MVAGFSPSSCPWGLDRAKNLFRIRKGQLIYSRLKAFEGEFGLVTDQFDGAYVSNEFPTFDCSPGRLYPQYLAAYFRAASTYVNADREVQRTAEDGPPIERCSAPRRPPAYGGDHARDSSPDGRRRECSPTWRSGPRSAGGCWRARSASGRRAASTTSTGTRSRRSWRPRRSRRGYRRQEPAGEAHARAVPAHHPPDPGGRPRGPARSSGTQPGGSSTGCGTSTGTPAARASSGRPWPSWKRTQAEVFVPLAHPPGEAQVDFGHAEVVIAGEPVTAALFVMTLPHSDAFFVRAFPKECTESFQDGHVRAFEYFGGVPTRISYDNSKVAVAAITGPRGRTPTREFLRLAEPLPVRLPVLPGAAAEREGARRGDGRVRPPQLPGPGPRGRLVGGAQRRVGPAMPGRPGPSAARARSSPRASCWRPSGRRCGRSRRAGSRPGGSSWRRPTRCRWSASTGTTTRCRRRTPTSRSPSSAGWTRSGWCAGTDLVARHRRHWGKEHVTFDPVHYLALLERKPGAFDYARPLDEWDLPEAFAVLRRRFEAAWGEAGVRHFIQVLRLLEKCSLGELAAAVERALAIGATTADAVRVLLEVTREAPVAAVPAGRPAAPGRGDASRGPTWPPTTPCGKEVCHEEDRDDQHGAAEAPPEGAAAADGPGRVREGGPAVRHRQRRPPRLPAPADRAGAARPGAAGGRAAAEGGPVPDREDAGGLRLRRPAVAEQGAGRRADAVRVHRPA